MVVAILNNNNNMKKITIITIIETTITEINTLEIKMLHLKRVYYIINKYYKQELLLNMRT